MVTIKGSTRIAGVIGNPVAHSLSPAMHNAAYEAMALDWVYVPFRVEDCTGLRRFLAAMPSLSIVGCNVTMPYKQDVLELCDQVAAAAQMAGAVNTIHCVDGRLMGYNTDGRGLLESLQSEVGFDPCGAEVVLLGSGGAAGAAFVSFVLAKVSRVTVVSRNEQAARALVERMAPHLGQVEAHVCAEGELARAVSSASLVVNTTPVGMQPADPSPLPAGLVGPGQVVYDMVYGRAESTALVNESRSAGATACDGLGMLVAQGALAIDIWDDSAQASAPRDVMRAAAERELATRAGV